MEYLLTQLDNVCRTGSQRPSQLPDPGLRRGSGARSPIGDIEMRMRIAQFPWLKTLEQFDFECHLSLNRKVVR
jgi:hypothetical protein